MAEQLRLPSHRRPQAAAIVADHEPTCTTHTPALAMVATMATGEDSMVSVMVDSLVAQCRRLAHWWLVVSAAAGQSSGGASPRRRRGALKMVDDDGGRLSRSSSGRFDEEDDQD
ncbi:hypothetical protein Dimus_039771 [Dionaea muscipula]